ncbi:MAG: hypothetical protein PHE84_14550 [bacterium]|nr:hypothetical protein [bacterium]
MNDGGKKFLWGFLAGVLITVVFFYIGGFTFLSQRGNRVEKEVKKTVGETTNAVEKAADKTKDFLKEKTH